MKNILAVLLISFIAVKSFSCDDYLQKFPRDCNLQNRIRTLKNLFHDKRVDVNEIAEYRVLRFVDRPSWEKAKTAQTSPKAIYNPAPATWQVWDEGMRSIFDGKDRTNGFLYRSVKLNSATFSRMNLVLLTNGKENIKDPHTDQKKKPGEFREGTDLGVGFCNPGIADSRGALEVSKKSMERFEQEWEHKIGKTFPQIVRSKGGIDADGASLVAVMTQSVQPACKAPNSWVNFVPTADVQKQLDWIRIFIETNLQFFQQGKPAMAPIELASYVQKWFVTVHPFSDGNGRTSRAIQDALLANFDLPFAPAGDLYNDATTDWDIYKEQTYTAMEKMVDLLEGCVKLDYKKPLAERPFYCATVKELNDRN